MKVGKMIKDLRLQHRMTQAELAKKLNLAPTAVSAWELERNKPYIDKIIIMSELFNVPVISFFRDVVEENKDSQPVKEWESDSEILEGIKRVADKHNLDLKDISTLDLLDSALDLVKRITNK